MDGSVGLWEKWVDRVWVCGRYPTLMCIHECAHMCMTSEGFPRDFPMRQPFTIEIIMFNMYTCICVCAFLYVHVHGAPPHIPRGTPKSVKIQLTMN